MSQTTLPSLSPATLGRLPPGVVRPTFDRAALQTGIVHLGVGAFHRAHQAVYTDAVLAGGDTRWGTIGASLRSSDTRDALAPQQGLYTVATRDGTGDRLQVVGSLGQVLVAPEDPGALLAALSDPRVRIVSLTLTEKGYHRDAASGALDDGNAEIRNDLAEPAAPRTALGFLVEAIRRRRAAGAPVFAVLSCDNLPANGRTVHRLLGEFAERRDRELARFIADEIHCPSTMVDRIVPATTAGDRRLISDGLGVVDAWPVMTEPFSQWVIEDAFGGSRPDWDRAGAAFVGDVEPYEVTKLRLLNGAHSTLAYLGWLAGYETISDVMAAPGFAALVRGMMDEEVTPGLPRLRGFDLTAYKDALIARFRNPALHHRTAQIAMDGSQKIPQRLLAPLRDRLAWGGSMRRLSLGVAGWMRYVMGYDEQGRPFAIHDPLAAELGRRVTGTSSPGAVVDALLDMPTIFAADLPRDPTFREALERHLSALIEQGSARVVSDLAAQKG